jgi:hypothetical protein
MDHMENSVPILDEQQVAAELNLGSLIASLADEQLITSILTKIARRSVMAQINSNVIKPTLNFQGLDLFYQYTLEFPSGSPLLLVEVTAETISSNYMLILTLNEQLFATTISNFYSHPYIWIPPSSQIDIFANANGVSVAHATGLQLAL